MVIIKSEKLNNPDLSELSKEQTSEQILELVQNLNPTYTRVFTQADLSIDGLLPVTHNLKSLIVKARVWNNSLQEVEPDSVTPGNVDTVAVGVETFTPLVGTFFIQITKVG